MPTDVVILAPFTAGLMARCELRPAKVAAPHRPGDARDEFLERVRLAGDIVAPSAPRIPSISHLRRQGPILTSSGGQRWSHSMPTQRRHRSQPARKSVRRI